MFDNDNRYFGYLGDYWDWYMDRNGGTCSATIGVG